MLMNDKQLVAHFGSWVRVQVAFYDYIFQAALELCPQHAMEKMAQNFRDGTNSYEDAVKAIEKKFGTFKEAWAAFRDSLKLNKASQDDRVMLGIEEVDGLLKPGEYVHTLIQANYPGTVLIGADVKRSILLEKAEKYGAELAGKAATDMGHGVVVWDGERQAMFCETALVAEKAK